MPIENEIAEIAQEQITDSLATVARVLVMSARAAAPKKTGEMASGITAEIRRDSNTVIVDSGPFYSRFLELGFRHIGGWKNKKAFRRVKRNRAYQQSSPRDGQNVSFVKKPFFRAAVYGAIDQALSEANL